MSEEKFHSGKGPIEKPGLSSDLPSDKFYAELLKQLIKVAKFTGAFRLAITLLTNKLNIIKAVNDLSVTVRFTADCVLFSLIYHLMRRLARHLRLKKKVNICRDVE